VSGLTAALAAVDAGAPAEEVGRVYAEGLGADRRARGAWYTPPAVIGHLLDRVWEPALDRWVPTGGPLPTLRDPCCGVGLFLLEAGRRLRRRGATGPVAGVLSGTDIDGDALRVAEALLARELGPGVTLRRADALLDDAAPVDVVVGNPPFLNQVEVGTTHGRARAAALKARFPGLVGAYTDPAWLHLVAAARTARGAVALVQPTSLLAARDAAAVRGWVDRHRPLTHLWVGGRAFEGVGTHVVGVVLGEAPTDRVSRSGPDLRPLPDGPRPGPASWSPLLPAPAGLDLPPHRAAGRLGDHAEATADFRDEYYGLVPHLVDAAVADEAAFPRLVTTGHVDPARCRWGERPTRFAKRALLHPRVDRAALSGRMAGWAARRLVPKLLVATQTRVAEAVVDADGAWLTSTPLLGVYPRDPAHLWRLAAVLLSPVATAWAFARAGGTSLSPDALKLSARQLLDLPLPLPGPAWDTAADHVRRAHLEPARRLAYLFAAAEEMDTAYGVEDPTLRRAWAERVR